MRPIVEILTEIKVPRIISILLLYALFVGLIVGLSLVVGPLLQYQLNRLIQNAPTFADLILRQWELFQANRAHFPDFVNDWIETVTVTTVDYLTELGRNITSIISGITSFIIALVVVPFILFYMLKDGHKLPEQVLKFIPSKQRAEGKTILADMNKAVSTYVIGQIIVSLCVGIMVFVGYSIIELEYSLILAIVAMLTNVIPFIGPFIGTFPAVIVGLIDSPIMMLKVLLVVIIAQQIESNLISPQVMGRVLEVHPLTIILLLLVAGSLAGLLGLILAVPIYAVSKVIVKHAHRLYKLRHSDE